MLEVLDPDVAHCETDETESDMDTNGDVESSFGVCCRLRECDIDDRRGSNLSRSSQVVVLSFWRDGIEVESSTGHGIGKGADMARTVKLDILIFWWGTGRSPNPSF